MKRFFEKSIYIFLVLFFLISCSNKNPGKKNNKKGPEINKNRASIKKVKSGGSNITKSSKPKIKNIKSKRLLYGRINFAQLMKIPVLLSKVDKIKVAAMKKGVLGDLLRCGADFTSNIDTLIFSFPQDFKKTKKGSLTLTGSFKKTKLVSCLAEKLKYKILGKEGNLQIIGNDKWKMYVKTDEKSIYFATNKKKFILKSVPSSEFGIFYSDPAKMPLILVGSTNPSIPWPEVPDSILLGIDANINYLQFRAVLNFSTLKSAKLSEKLIEKQIVGFIKKSEKENINSSVVKFLKKLGIKRKQKSILSALKLKWQDVFEIIKLVKVKVTAKN